MENILPQNFFNKLLLDNNGSSLPIDYVIEPVSQEEFTRPVSPNEKIFGEEYRVLDKININDNIYADNNELEIKTENIQDENKEEEEEIYEQYFNEKKILQPTPTDRLFSILSISASNFKKPCKLCFLQDCICEEFL